MTKPEETQKQKQKMAIKQNLYNLADVDEVINGNAYVIF